MKLKDYAVVSGIFAVAVVLLYMLYMLYSNLDLIEQTISSDKDNNGGISERVSVWAIYGAVGAALFTSVLTFLAFWVQYIFNKKVRDEQENERYRSDFFDLLKIHQAQKNDNSQVSFYYLFYEFKSLYYYVCKYFNSREIEEVTCNGILEVVNKNEEKRRERGVEDAFSVYCAYNMLLCGLYMGERADVEFNREVLHNYEKHTGKLFDEKSKRYILAGLKVIENAIGSANAKEGNLKIAFVSNREMGEKKHIYFQGHLITLSAYLKTVEAIVEHLAPKKFLEKGMTLPENVEHCREIFVSQLSIHEVAFLNVYYRGNVSVRKHGGDVQNISGMNEKVSYIFKEIEDKDYYKFSYNDPLFFKTEK